MARSDAVWGIDIGNCSLKALRCRPGESNRVIADAFDYIEYPKILTQPGADPGELVADAIGQFLSRNSVLGDRVAISVSGQNGLARFIKLPPVEAKKIPDIVRYEARQQIPFDLDDVIWDYQRMGGGSTEEGFLLETEIGLFAMKRDQVYRALEPFDAAGIGVDYIQLTPLALFNFVVYDQLVDLPAAEEYDPDNPPPSVVVLSMGTDASDLVVTNGFRVWQRNIPIGGNHFTKVLTKELKLTFVKAEHLKRNAATAEDPKAVFQAMRPVFSDLLTEVQRSIGYFNSIDRSAKIERVLAFGSPIKLPGLRRYLAQGLGVEVARLESFQNLSGPEVFGAPAFQENQTCFPVCYGLAIQGLERSSLGTNLLPKEIVKDRVIREKKPWAVAAAALLLLGCTLSLATLSRALATVDPARFKQPETDAKQVVEQFQGFKSKADQITTEFGKVDTVGQHVVENVEGRLRWLELLKAVGDCLPSDPPGQTQQDISLHNQLFIDSLRCQFMPNIGTWESYVAAASAPKPGATPGAGGPDAVPTATPPAGSGPAATAVPAATAATDAAGTLGAEGPQDPGWLVTIQGHHFHNPRQSGGGLGGELYVSREFLDKLRNGVVFLPTNDPMGPAIEKVTMKELGISSPMLVNSLLPYKVFLQNPHAAADAAGPSPTMMGRAGATPGMPMGTPMGTPMARSGVPPGYSAAGMSGGPGGRVPPGYSATGSASPGPMLPGSASMGPGTAGAAAADTTGGMIEAWRMNFTVQFAWKPVPRSERIKKRPAGAAAETPALAPATGPGAGPAPGSNTPPGSPAQPGKSPS